MEAERQVLRLEGPKELRSEVLRGPITIAVQVVELRRAVFRIAKLYFIFESHRLPDQVAVVVRGGV